MKTQSDLVLLSIQTEHAEKIYSGQKKAELRKSFASHPRIVFLYETSPVSAITGAFVVGEATRTTVESAIEIAQKAGIPRERATYYYGDRKNGWIVTVAFPIKFAKPIPLADLKATDHYFLPPQSFLYLSKYEGLTQDLLEVFRFNLKRGLTLRKLSPVNRDIVASLIRSDIAENYEDIDHDFVRQVLDERVGSEAAFSTTEKRVLEFSYRGEILGFTVVTVKRHGAWKTGPTVLLPAFRGVLLGQELRQLIESYCKDKGARSVYCTCAATQPMVVSYLLNSEMQLQARLNGHLSRERDELVLSKKLTDTPAEYPKKLKNSSTLCRIRVKRVLSSEKGAKAATNYFLRNMSSWYFRPHDALYDSIVNSLKSYESGDLAYSSKGRVLYQSLDNGGRTLAVALLTPKRSMMLKINLSAAALHRVALKKLIGQIIKDFAHYRRIYLTIPAQHITAIEVLGELSFNFEGILQEPFVPGVDHACFGINH